MRLSGLLDSPLTSNMHSSHADSWGWVTSHFCQISARLAHMHANTIATCSSIQFYDLYLLGLAHNGIVSSSNKTRSQAYFLCPQLKDINFTTTGVHRTLTPHLIHRLGMIPEWV